MANRYVVEDLRATGWSLRLRDTETGEFIDVPMNHGSRFSPPRARDTGEPEHKHDADGHDQVSGADTPAAPPRAPRKAAKKASRKKEPKASRTPADAANPLETREGRHMPIDEKTLTEDDRKVIADHQAFWAHVLGAKGSKKGGLGWEEATDAGRSGLRARFKSGAFKILHAGGDTYALFYEWDSGKYERIACGKAEDMMEIATTRALEKLPPPPRSMLDLEMARFMCSSDAEQRKLGGERLAPIFREQGARAEKRRAEEGEGPPPRTRGRRSAAPVTEPSPPPPSNLPPSPPSAADTAVDPQRDAELMSSLSQALAEMED